MEKLRDLCHILIKLIEANKMHEFEQQLSQHPELLLTPSAASLLFTRAAALGNTPAMALLLSKDASIMIQSMALLMATANGKYPAVKWLLEHRADPNVQAVTRVMHPHQQSVVIDQGDTSSHVAARQNLVAIAALLQQHGADPSIRNQAGETAREVGKAQTNDFHIAGLFRNFANNALSPSPEM